MKAMITDIKRFAVHDGDGIRTTVFFKGCPLRCLWCHNPEGFSPSSQLAFFSHKCTLCSACASVCPLHKIENGRHDVFRKDCTHCGRCVAVCPSDALKLYGTEWTPQALFELILEDLPFYAASGGGVTLSGGECLIYPDFCAALLRLCKEKGIHTAIDTCGYVDRSHFDAVLPYTDLFLYDIKALDSELHQRCTGVKSELILDNLRYLNEKGCRIEIRIPSIPHYTEGEVEKIQAFAKPFPMSQTSKFCLTTIWQDPNTMR